jgi:hypothetical protein
MEMPGRDALSGSDLRARLRLFRAARQDAAMLLQQVTEHLQACHARAAQTAPTLADAGTQTLARQQIAHAQRLTQLATAAQRQQTALLQQYQQTVGQATAMRRWLPPSRAAWVLGGLLLLNVGVLAWGGRTLTNAQQRLQQTVALATDLERYVRATLSRDLSPVQQQAIDTIFQAQQRPALGQRVP